MSERPYLGTAGFYERFRHRLSERFARLLVERLGLSSDDVVLDLGCGPARVARQLAPFVSRVIAVDAEPEMVAEGERCCLAEGIDNVRCLVGRSDDLAFVAEWAPFRAVTIGTAFHWMVPQDEVLGRLDPLVARGGAVAIVGPETGVPAQARPAWADELEALLNRYLEGAPRGFHPGGRHDPFEQILARSPFPLIEELVCEYEVEQQLTLEAELGFRYSLSWVLQQLGERRAAFEGEARQLLAGRIPAGPVRKRRRDWALIARRAVT